MSQKVSDLDKYAGALLISDQPLWEDIEKDVKQTLNELAFFTSAKDRNQAISPDLSPEEQAKM